MKEVIIYMSFIFFKGTLKHLQNRFKGEEGCFSKLLFSFFVGEKEHFSQTFLPLILLFLLPSFGQGGLFLRVSAVAKEVGENLE